MIEEVFRNQFRGLQSDLDKAETPSENYLSAHNLTLTSQGGFLSLANIRGTSEIDTLIENFTGNVLGVYANKYTIESVEGVECLTIFTAVSGENFKIWCYDLENTTAYELFTEAFTSEFEASNPQIDAICYPESSLDVLYFTDSFNEVRKLRCEISSYTPNFLTVSQLSLQRRGTMGRISDVSVTTGGSLFSGSYQFVLRYYNQATRTYTKWTVPSTPVIVSREVEDAPSQGGYSITTTKKIILTINAPTYAIGEYSHYQMAVIENTSATSILNGSLQKIEDLTGVVAGEFTNITYTYSDNTKIQDVPLSDIVVDLAAIRSVKTLQIKNNRLFGGNLKYWEREYDNGDPEVTGNVMTASQDLRSDTAFSKYKGHFRDEVYRYYVSYHDEYFNFSRPKRLDASSITNNQIANGDVRYPSRKVAGYTVLDATSTPISIGLNLTITSHPSWAKGFIVLRAERKKRIKFQSPFVPSSQIQGVEAVGDYPNEPVGKDYPDATPMNPVGTLVPKNFFHTVKKDMVRTTASVEDEYQKGEVRYTAAETATESNSVYYVYPPTMYGSTYNFIKGDSYEVVDHAFLRMLYENFESDPQESRIGRYLQTSIHGSFYATDSEDYYYSPSVSRTAPDLPTLSGELTEFKELDALGEGTNISSASLGQQENLVTPGVFYNTAPNNQRSAAFMLKTPRQDTALYGSSAYGGSQMVSSGGGVVVDTFYEINQNAQTNTFAPSKVGGVNEAITSIVDIVNIVSSLGDDRYGDADDIHDIVFTGASYVFSESEVTQVESDGMVSVNLQVFGGDCFVNLQQVKLTDSHYGLVNAEKYTSSPLSVTALRNRWDIIFKNRYFVDLGDFTNGNQYWAFISMPVAYKNVSQTLSVMVESEVLMNVLEPYPYNDFEQKDSKYVITEDTESKLRLAFGYGYNINYSKESTQKAFIPFSEDEIVTTLYKSRGVFSDIKIYQTDIQGFDIFRTSNTFDLEETYGGITKLTLVGDELYAIQENATVYVPVDANEISTASGDTISVRSGDVVSLARYISRLYGTSHLKSVVTKDNLTMFVDNATKTVVKIQGGSFDIISEKGAASEFSELLAADVESIIGMWDNSRRQYIIKFPETVWVWDDRLGVWVGEYDTARLRDGVYAYHTMYTIGVTGEDLTINSLYTGDYNVLFGETVTPSVSFSVNPEFPYAKTFDNVNIYSDNKLATLDIVSARETGATNQEVTGIDIDINRREGSYRAQILRDSGGARIRGTRATITLKWRTDNEKVLLTTVATKWRPSQRMI
jgi:hypothetical protein